MPVIVRIDHLLLERRMTLTRLSEKVGLSLTALSQIKTGKGFAMRYTTLEKLCTALECTPGELFKIVSQEEYERYMNQNL